MSLRAPPWDQFFSSSTSTTLTLYSIIVSKFADDTNIRNAALSEQGRRSLQDLRKLYDRSEKWEMPFNINCHILQIGSKKRKMANEMCGVKIKSV